MKPVHEHRLRPIEIEVHGEGRGEGEIFENQTSPLLDPLLHTSQGKSAVDLKPTVIIVYMQYAGFKTNRLRPARLVHAGGSFWRRADSHPGTGAAQ